MSEILGFFSKTLKMYISPTMSDVKNSEKSLSTIVFENLKELVKAKNAAHESIFKFHWKKLWPFNLIWPQVDYLRIIRFMGEVGEQAIQQKEFIARNKNKASTEELAFLNAVPNYLDALTDSCDKLAEVAQFKQNILEKIPNHGAFSFKKKLDAYAKAQDHLVRMGAFVQVHWMEKK